MKKTHTSALSLMKTQRARLERWKTDARTAFGLVVMDTRNDATALTSGTVTTRQLRKMGHPFGRSYGGKGGKPRGRLASTPINVQDGRLRRSFSIKQIGSRGIIKFGLLNKAPYAKYILRDAGTRKMIGRGFQKEISRRHKARISAFLRHYRQKQTRS